MNSAIFQTLRPNLPLRRPATSLGISPRIITPPFGEKKSCPSPGGLTANVGAGDAAKMDSGRKDNRPLPAEDSPSKTWPEAGNPAVVKLCNYCSQQGNFRCTRCKMTCYCSVACQTEDWKAHRHVCKTSAQESPSSNKTQEPVTSPALSGPKSPESTVRAAPIGQDKRVYLHELPKNKVAKGTQLQYFTVTFTAEMALESHYDLIQNMMLQGSTYNDISSTLVSMGVVRGSSVANIKMFCQKHNLQKFGWSSTQLEAAVSQAAQETGGSYGRRMMTGYLASKGVHASQQRVGAALRVVQPPSHEARTQGLRNLNSMPYSAAYMGHKLHMDQNEKMAMFGVTYVLAIDGYSGKIVGHAIMPKKNNLIIYEDVYKTAVLNYGLWDQVRVDHGREFFLSLFVQEKLSGLRFNQERPSYLQTQSTRNHRIERVWPEVNNRVTYPLKAAITNLVDQEALNMEDDTVRFCVSNLTCQVASVGLQRFVDAWNSHTVEGRGIPNVLSEGGCRVKLTADQLPTASEAADLYEQENNSTLTRTSVFGRDPFVDVLERDQVERRFTEAYSDITVLFEVW